jgi:hygromycin-B 4-O-kinase
MRPIASWKHAQLSPVGCVKKGIDPDGASAQALKKELRLLFNGEDVNLEPLSHDGDNDVFLAVIDRERFIVKIPRLADVLGYRALVLNKWCADRLEPLGVPAPKTITIKVRTEEYPTYSVEEHSTGTNAASLSWKDQLRCFDSCLYQMAGLAIKIHSIRVEGFGPLDQNGCGQFSSWQAFLRSPAIVALERIAWCDESDLALDELVGSASGLLYELSKSIAPGSARLLHGDLAPNNILLDGAKISGILDWGDALGGDPLYDLALFEFFCGTSAFARLLSEYDKHSPVSLAKEQETLDCYRLSIALSKFNWRVLVGRQDLLARPVRLIRHIARRYKDHSFN